MRDSVKWSKCKLHELGFVGRGRSRHRPRNEPTLYGGPYPFFQTADIMQSILHMRRYSQTYSEKGLAQSKLWDPGTLCMTIAGANTAQTAILGIRGCFPDSIVGFIADPDKADVRFVKYYLDTLKKQFRSVSRGTTQDNLSLDKLLSFDLCVPDADTQAHIASVISAYDELIETNNRRIEILDDMARLVYKEWFVHLRYPGSELAEENSLPDGWVMSSLGQACSILMGQSPPSKFYNEVQDGLPFHQGVTNFGSYFPSDSTHCSGSHRTADRWDILFSVRAPVGRINLARNKMVIGRGLSAIRSKTDHQMFALYQLKDRFREEDTMGGGTIFKAVTRDDMHSIPFLIPNDVLLTKFNSIATSIVESIENMTEMNENLAKTRDLLIPRLLSRTITLSPPDPSPDLVKALA